MLIDCGIDRGELQAEQDLRKEALLGALEPAARRRLGAAVERPVLKTIDDAGEFECRLEVLMDDRLSRGSGNAKERGLGAGFLGRGTQLLRIILIANLGGLWTS